MPDITLSTLWHDPIYLCQNHKYEKNWACCLVYNKFSKRLQLYCDWVMFSLRHTDSEAWAAIMILLVWLEIQESQVCMWRKRSVENQSLVGISRRGWKQDWRETRRRRKWGEYVQMSLEVGAGREDRDYSSVALGRMPSYTALITGCNWIKEWMEWGKGCGSGEEGRDSW